MPVHDLGASILLAHVDYTRLARLIFTTLSTVDYRKDTESSVDQGIGPAAP